MDPKFLVNIEYWTAGKQVAFTYLPYYPNYHTGETLYLNTVPTQREKARRPKQAMTRKFYRIERVHHIVTQNKREENFFFLEMEVHLEELEDIEIDKNGA